MNDKYFLLLFLVYNLNSMMTKYIIILLMSIFSIVLYSQEYVSEHIMSVDSTYSFDTTYSVQNLAWISGYWIGEGLGGEVEEVWSAPKNGQMLCLFRYDAGAEMIFSEHCSMVNTSDGVKFRVRHFNADFTAWEDKEAFVEFPLISMEGQTAYFDGCTIIREGSNLKIYVYIEHDGSAQEELFEYQLKAF